jgi:hypothetical protein
MPPKRAINCPALDILIDEEKTKQAPAEGAESHRARTGEDIRAFLRGGRA